VLLFVTADFFRRRRRVRRADDEMPAGPLLRVVIFWMLFGLGALVGGVAIVAAVAGSWIASAAGFLTATGCLAGSIVIWRQLNRLD
jgi:hypothetical protein